jgi:SAM-dependent methyltransferase
LEEVDSQDYIERYEKRLEEFGYSPETLGWGKNSRQEVRFAILSEYALNMPENSVLDVGCGFADLYDFLIQHRWHGQYTGIEIVPGLLNVAKERHPDLDLRRLDITSEDISLELYDFAIASGVLNAKLKVGDNQAHIVNVLTALYRYTRVAACADFLSTYVDFQKPGSWHTDPGWALGVAKKLSRRVLLRHDYMPFEFALFIFKDESISERNVFQAFENSL